jgi:iron(III) transport system substrate-binding protein
MRRILSTKILVILAAHSLAWGQGTKPSSLAELAAYTGADREQILAAGAKAEGKVTWYTSLAGGSYKELAATFEKKYGVKVEAYRGSSQDLLARITAEAQAKRFLVDSVESTMPLMKAMRDDRLIAPFYSPHLGKYPPEAKEKADRGLVFWASARESYIGVAYNKKAIGAKDAPKSFEDLLKPAFKDKLAFATSDTGSRMIAAMLQFQGEEYVRKFKQQNVRLYAVSGRALLDLVISGEVGVSPTIFRNHALVAIEQGAPVAWMPMEVVPTNAGAVTPAARAPRPHAALLFNDFILGPEGQKILEKFEYGSASSDYGFKRWYPEQGLTTEQYEKANDRWDKLLREIGRKQ